MTNGRVNDVLHVQTTHDAKIEGRTQFSKPHVAEAVEKESATKSPRSVNIVP